MALAGRFLFDVSGLVQWYAFFRHPSGVQRVTERVLSSYPFRHHQRVEFVARIISTDVFHRVDASILWDLSKACRRDAAIARLRALFAQSMRMASPTSLRREIRAFHLPYVIGGYARLERMIDAWFAGTWQTQLPSLEIVRRPDRGDVFFNPGDYWCHDGYVQSLLAFQRDTGVKLVQLLHDTFVVDEPQWANPRFHRAIVQGLESLAPNVEQWLTPSQYVKSALSKYLASKVTAPSPIAVLPMGWDSHSLKSNSADDQSILRRHGLAGDRYILHVGTVEPRKNLSALLDALQQLRKQAGALVPKCVLVGRDGWTSAALRKRLKSSRYEDGTVLWFKNVSDRELAALYRGAMFTVVPSSLEGWGLPVRESLAYGVPCLATRAGALEEAGLGLADYFEPADSQGLRGALWRWINDEGALSAARAHIADRSKSIRATSWDDTGGMVLETAFGTHVAAHSRTSRNAYDACLGVRAKA